MQNKAVRSSPFVKGKGAVAEPIAMRTGGAGEPTIGANRRQRRVDKIQVSTRWAGRLLALVAFFGLLAPGGLRAQTEPSKAATATSRAATMPLAQYVPKEHLILYVEFAGLDAHAASWQNTASFKMLTETPLGVMLEEVAGQLLERFLTFMPNRRVSGAEVVTLMKGAFKSGWLFAVHTDPKGTAVRTTLVVRGAVSKELRPISSRLMGSLMGAGAKYKTEYREGRTVVVVPYAAVQEPAAAGTPRWVWWPEKNDLVIGSSYPESAEKIMSALDGKTPNVVDHSLLSELRKTEGTFEPVCVGFIETSLCPDVPSGLMSPVRSLHQIQGINHIDFRWGFDADALMTVTRLVAPKPWKAGLALFDERTFDKTSLMPKPDSVDSFVELSIDPSRLIDALEQIPAAAAIKAQIDDLTARIKKAGQIDLRKDILSHLGPRVVGYLAAGRTATANDDSLEAALKNGLTTTTAVTVMQTFFPKLTLVAEVKDQEAFGKGLDAMIIAMNTEIEAQAKEKEAEAREAAAKAKPGAAGRDDSGASRPANKRERSRPRRILAPRFNPIPGQTKAFVLMTPTDSKLRFGPSSFRPTIMMQGKYVAFAVSTDAARAAIAAASRQDWKPSAELERASQKLPTKLVMFSMTNDSERLSSTLASLPGTLQTMVNTSIALANARTQAATAAAAAGGPAGGTQDGQAPAAAGTAAPGGGASGGPRFPRMRGPGGTGAPSAGSGSMKKSPGAPGSAATGASGAAFDAMIVIKVDPEKLPKAADLKTSLFPATFAIGVNEQQLRLISRSAFPDFSSVIGMAPALSIMPPLPMLDWIKGLLAGTSSQGTASEAPAPAASEVSPSHRQAGGPAAQGEAQSKANRQSRISLTIANEKGTVPWNPCTK